MPDPSPMIERVERRLGMALRLVDREREDADLAHRAAMARLARAQRDAAERPARAARTQADALHDIDHRYASRLAALATQTRDAAERAAAGAAAADWARWERTPVDRAAQFPLLRIGEVRIDIRIDGDRIDEDQ